MSRCPAKDTPAEIAAARARAACEGSSAIVLKIDTRYFCRFGKSGRVQTAWSLAGAKLYLSAWALSDEWKNDLKRLEEKDKRPIPMRVVLDGEVMS